MTPHDKDELLRQRQSLTEELAGLSHLIRGSVVVGEKKCNRPNCRCHNGEPHPHVVISTTYRGGKTQIVYVSKVSREAATAAVGEYQRAREILEELSSINVELFRARELYPPTADPQTENRSGGDR